MDLRDLEWKYYKGITKWARKTSDSYAKIKYNSEKRFVESKEMPGSISPSLVRRSLVIYPLIDYPQNVPSTSEVEYVVYENILHVDFGSENIEITNKK